MDDPKHPLDMGGCASYGTNPNQTEMLPLVRVSPNGLHTTLFTHAI